MSPPHSKSIGALACLAAAATTATHAAELTDTAAPNTDMRYVAASVQRDARQAQVLLGLLSLPVGDRGWVQLGGGQTRHEQDTTVQKTSVVNAGAGYIGTHWQASLAASHRDAGSRLRQTDWDATVEWLGEHVGIGVDGHRRDARLSGTTPSAPPATVGVPIVQRIEGNGFGLHGHVQLSDNFHVHAATMHYDYQVSTQQGGGASGGSTSLLSRVLLQAAPSFVSREETALSRSSRFGASYRFAKLTAFGEFIADRVLDEPGTVRTVLVKASFHPAPQWTVTPTLGRTRSEAHGGVTFAGLTLSLGW